MIDEAEEIYTGSFSSAEPSSRLIERISLQEKSASKKISPYQLCSILNEKNKALMGRIISFLDNIMILEVLSLVERKLEEGAIDSKGSLFIRILK